MTLNQSIALAMDCKTTEIVPYLPYILQDFTEIGSSAQSIVLILQEYDVQSSQRVLDLGCGKGYASVAVAQAFGCQVLGVDGMKAFVDHGTQRAQELGLGNLKFIEADIREPKNIPGAWDWIILGSIGPVIGNYCETLEYCKQLLAPNGKVLLDDGYLKDSYGQITRDYVVSQIELAEMRLDREYLGDQVYDPSETEQQMAWIRVRCQELKVQHPEKSQLFQDYIDTQVREYEFLESLYVSSSMVICRQE
jgi:cyclopropane fatty-acyl-phospholipid synthase-like methyltransferase